jgi:hypothetical protein
MSTPHTTNGLSPVRAEAALRDILAILADAGLTTAPNSNGAIDPRPLSSWLQPVSPPAAQSGR